MKRAKRRDLTIATARYFNYKISPVNVGMWQRGMDLSGASAHGGSGRN
jgi:hypothetical protein